jgi:hypothetical protein
LAQELALSDMFGRGAHAYFSGQPRLAYEYLNAAINAGTRDPRPYYFRGLAYQQMGRPAEAKADFQLGAALEHEDVGGLFYVDRSLERVQGASRLTIERYRAAARVGAAQTMVMERNQRIVTARGAQPQVAAPGEQVLSEQPSGFESFRPANPPRAKAEVDQPFNEPTSVPPAAPPKPAPPVPLQENPFENPAKPQAANPPAAQNGEGTAKALGNAIKRAFGPLVPSVPEVPAGLPLGGAGNPPAPNNP